jgi:hypothetical protein
LPSSNLAQADQSLAKIPKGSSIGAFAVQNRQQAPILDKYVLYQDISGTIQLMWQDDESGWKGPTNPSAFLEADNGTSIACLTPMAWRGTSLIHGFVQTCRCYFQSDGALKEVWYNGDDWQIAKTIPTT